jgi:hypothetical protein
MSHIAEVAPTRGLIWDQISVASSDGLKPLAVASLPKGQARLNETAVTPPLQPRR